MQVVVDTHAPGRGGSVAVGADRHHFQVTAERAGADEVGQKNQGALEDTDEQRLLSGEAFGEGLAEFLYARFDFVLCI